MGRSHFLYESEPGDEYNGWNLNDIGESGTHIFNTNGGPYSTITGTQGAFRVQVNAVPEASTTASFGLLLALGLGGMVIAKKRKQSA